MTRPGWLAALAGCIPAVIPPAPADPRHDFDGDGWSELDGDCDDVNASAAPDRPEVCSDGRDNDCDGTAGGCGLWGTRDADLADRVLFAPDAGALAGTSLAVADLDGDGSANLVLGAPTGDGGRVSVVGEFVAGRTSLSGSRATLHGAPGAWFGVAVAVTPDLDGDGRPDLVIGAPGGAVDADPGTEGEVYLFSGASTGERSASDAIAVLVGGPGTVAGTALAGGDVDGDGIGDVVVGTEHRDDGGQSAGALFVVRGPVAGTVALSDAPSVARVDGAAGEQVGVAVLEPVDLDGDGGNEVAVGVPGALYEGQPAGAVRVYPPELGAPTIVLTGTRAGDAVGTSLAAADTDGDGYVDLAIGSPSDRDQERGSVYVVSGPLAPALQAFELDYAETQLVGESAHDDLGDNLSSPGDVDGDGIEDLWVSSEDHANTPSDSGIAYLVLGGRTGTIEVASADARVVGGGRSAFGKAVAGGDLTGDGWADTVVGAPLADLGLAQGGAAYVYLGGAP